MNSWEIVVGIVLGLAVNETCDLSPWLAKQLVRWSANFQYGDDERAELRAVEWASVIDSRPGKLFKLFTAVGFVLGASFARVQRIIKILELIGEILKASWSLTRLQFAVRKLSFTKEVGSRRYYRRGHWVARPRKRK